MKDVEILDFLVTVKVNVVGTSQSLRPTNREHLVLSAS